MNQTTIVALNNLLVKSEEPVDPKALLLLGELANQHLEDNREAYAKAWSDLVCFGTCTLPAFKF